MRLKNLFAVFAIFLIAACAPPEFAERSETISRTLTVREINPEDRSFAVTGDGQRFVLRVSDAVKNFDQIEVGDKLNIDYIESVAVGMADPADQGETLALDAVGVAEPGEKPGIAGGEFVSTVVEFISYDRATHTAVVKTQSGDIFATKVRRELRRFASTRQPGDRIAVDIATGLAVNIAPAS